MLVRRATARKHASDRPCGARRRKTNLIAQKMLTTLVSVISGEMLALPSSQDGGTRGCELINAERWNAPFVRS